MFTIQMPLQEVYVCVCELDFISQGLIMGIEQKNNAKESCQFK